MKQLMIASALFAAGTLGLQDIALAHGGTYRGPGDTVPPGGGGGGGGGGPSTPGPSGPSAPGPSGPGTPGPASPGAPAGGPSGPSKPKTGGAASAEPDLTVWQFWWGFNKEPYLNLKAAIHGGGPLTGSDDFYLGRGETTQARDTYRPSEEAIRGKIVPALIKALNTETSNDILTGAMIALAKIGDAKGETGISQMGELIKPFLTNGQQEVAETAAVSLGILANPENIDLLVSIMNSDQTKLNDYNQPGGPQFRGAVATRSRAFAAYGLGLIGHAATQEADRLKINEALRNILEGEGKSMPTRDVQVGCITSIGLTPLEVASEWTAPTERLDKWKVPETIQSRQDQLQYLIGYYNDQLGNNYLIRAHAPTAMARLLGDMPDDFPMRAKVAELLIGDLSQHSKAQDAIQQSCALALGQIADCDDDALDQQMRQALADVKDNLADQQTRNFALIALAQAGGRPGKGANPVYGAVVDPKVDRKAINVRAYLQEQMLRGKNAVRPWAAIAIGVMERSLSDQSANIADNNGKLALGREATMTALGIQVTEAKTPEDVGAFAIAAGIAQYNKAKDALLVRLDKTKENEARGYVAVGLGLMNERSAIEPIQQVVAESKYKPDLLKQAAIALGLLGDKQLVPDLIDMLANAQGLSAQAALSSALGFIGDARSIQPLIDMLGDKQITDLARGFAAVALGIVADKEELPWNSKIGVNSNYRASTTTLTDGSLGILDIL